MSTKDIIDVVLGVWANANATIALILAIVPGKKKTAPKKSTKHKRKR